PADQLTCAFAKALSVVERRERKLADLVRLRSREGIRPDLHHLLRSRLGDLFDVHATGCRDNEHQASPIAIERDAEVELVIDLERLLAPEGVHRVIANPQREDALRFPAR